MNVAGDDFKQKLTLPFKITPNRPVENSDPNLAVRSKNYRTGIDNYSTICGESEPGRNTHNSGQIGSSAQSSKSCTEYDSPVDTKEILRLTKKYSSVRSHDLNTDKGPILSNSNLLKGISDSDIKGNSEKKFSTRVEEEDRTSKSKLNLTNLTARPFTVAIQEDVGAHLKKDKTQYQQNWSDPVNVSREMSNHSFPTIDIENQKNNEKYIAHQISVCDNGDSSKANEFAAKQVCDTSNEITSPETTVNDLISRKASEFNTESDCSSVNSAQSKGILSFEKTSMNE